MVQDTFTGQNTLVVHGFCHQGGKGSGQLIGLLAESADRLTVYERLPNPATGGALRLTAYDAEGNTLFTACYNGWLVVTFGNEMTNYVFDASDCELYTLYTFFPVE